MKFISEKPNTWSTSFCTLVQHCIKKILRFSYKQFTNLLRTFNAAGFKYTDIKELVELKYKYDNNIPAEPLQFYVHSHCTVHPIKHFLLHQQYQSRSLLSSLFGLLLASVHHFLLSSVHVEFCFLACKRISCQISILL